MAFREVDNAEYEQVRREMVVSSAANRKSDTAALACPIFDNQLRLVGALSLAGPSSRFSKATTHTMRQHLLSASIELTEQLGGNSSPLYRAR